MDGQGAFLLDELCEGGYNIVCKYGLSLIDRKKYIICPMLSGINHPDLLV